jgi:IS30 family transposase
VDRKQAGHWEADTMVGKDHGSAIQILVERQTRFVRLKKLPARGAMGMRLALTRSLVRYPKGLRRTITYDNGRENTQHLLINRALGTRSFFCAPMHSWEKGSVENAAGLVRRRLPKKTNFAIVLPAEIKQTERWLNGLPRKCLGFRTAAEAFRRSVALTG